jgi:hypothetical protein
VSSCSANSLTAGLAFATLVNQQNSPPARGERSVGLVCSGFARYLTLPFVYFPIVGFLSLGTLRILIGIESNRESPGVHLRPSAGNEEKSYLAAKSVFGIVKAPRCTSPRSSRRLVRHRSRLFHSNSSPPKRHRYATDRSNRSCVAALTFAKRVSRISTSVGLYPCPQPSV